MEVNVMKDRIDIKSLRTRDFSTKVVISDQNFLVETELNGKTKPTIKSRIYREGKIVSTYKQDLDNVTDKASIRELMLEHHQLSIEAMKEELYTPETIPANHSLLDTVGNIAEALDMLQTKRSSNDDTGNIKETPNILQTERPSNDDTGNLEETLEIIPTHYTLDNAAGNVEKEPEIIPTLYTLDHAAGYIEEPQTPVILPSNLISKRFMDVIEKALETTRTEKLPEDAVDNVEKAQKPDKSPSEYLKETNILLARRNLSNAMGLICEGVDNHPKDPSLLSLHGYLTVKVQKDYKRGIHNCKKAIEIIRRRLPSDPAFVYPNFFLNLGRAYIAAGDRKHAVDTFMKVLYVDESNSLVRMEMRKLGARRKPFIAFLSRSNPLNKYAGLIIYRLRRRVA
jgi:tetratricopeptide (TPR) repeat protein